jgi:hypothetical protein
LVAFDGFIIAGNYLLRAAKRAGPKTKPVLSTDVILAKKESKATTPQALADLPSAVVKLSVDLQQPLPVATDNKREDKKDPSPQVCVSARILDRKPQPRP